MKANAKSSITLPAGELKLVRSLKARLHAKSNVEVIRRGIRLLQESTDREALRSAFRAASKAVRPSTLESIEELDHLAGEGLD
jgi:hypothetical protein